MSALAVLLTGLLAFLGSAAGHAVARLTAREQERWRRREETMRLLRWAAEMAAEPRGSRVEIGTATIDALIDSPLLDLGDVGFVAAVSAACRDRRRCRGSRGDTS
jgi:hypothetical protein